MSRFNRIVDRQFFMLSIILLTSLLIAGPAQAAEGKSSAKKSKVTSGFKKHRRTTVGFTYVTWAETATATGSGTSVQIPAYLVGNILSLEEQFFLTTRLYYTLFGGAMFGLADVGGSQTSVSYHVANEHFYGVVLQSHFGYRVTPQAEFSVGPMIVYRSMSLPTTSVGNSAVSGSSFNYGATVDTRLFVAAHWLLRFEMGLLLSNASTYWTLGAGYRF